jgi:hypothetical protein
MPKRVVAEGRTFTFPDDATDEQISNAVTEQLRPRPTAASREIPERQERVSRPPPAEGPWYRQAATNVGRFFSGEGQRQEGVGEIAYQSVPERDDVRWEGGPLSPALNALPRQARTWLDAQGRANAIGVGFFLNPNERHRAQIIQRQIPDAQFRRDEHGALQVRYNEETPWAYINRPGMSVEDVQTFANEMSRYLATRRLLPGGGRAQPGATSPLLTSTAREMAAGGLSMAGGQEGSRVVGGPGSDPVDVAVSSAGAGAGNLIAHGISATARGAPGATREAIDWIADRLPGGAQRVAERQAAAQELIAGMEDAARRQATESVRANAQQMNLVGEGLDRAIREAEDAAVQIVREQTQGGGQAIDELARSFGVRLSKSQIEGDIGGMQFMYEAAGGLHGPGAQRAAVAFFSAQNQALPQGMRAIVPNPTSISSPEAGVNVARAGAERAFETARGTERQAWRAFDDAVQNVRTYEQTPILSRPDGRASGGNPSGMFQLRDSINGLLEQNRIFITPRTGANGAPPTEAAEGVAAAFRQSYPLVHRALSMIDNLAPATRDDVPLRDVERVVQIKRFIDDLWDASADNPAQRRLLSQMGSTVRDWLRDEGGRALRDRGARVTADKLQEALGASRELNRTFRDNRIVRSIVEPEPNSPPPTDEEVMRRLFGGGRGGLNVGSDGVQALRALRDGLGARSPEWESVRQAAVQRLTQGLDNAIETNQTPAILTTYNRFNDAFRASREAMEVLFTPEELARLRQAQVILARMAPTPRNPANPSNSGIVAGRATKGAMQALGNALRGIPGASTIAGGAMDAAAAARVNVETAGAPGQGFEIARALSRLWNVDRQAAGAGGAIGAAWETTDNAAARGRETASGDVAAIEDRQAPPPQERPIDTTRPMLDNADGTFSTEETITIEADGRYINIPTIINGRRVDEGEAYAAWRRGMNPEVGSFGSLEEAEAAARTRSAQIGRVRSPERAP